MADESTAMSGKDLYLAVMTLTSTIATVVSTFGSFIPAQYRDKVIAIGVLSSVAHGVLMDPKTLAAIKALLKK